MYIYSTHTQTHTKHGREKYICVDQQWCSHDENQNVTDLSTFLLLPLGFPVMEKQQVSFVLSSFHLTVSLHHQAHLEDKWQKVTVTHKKRSILKLSRQYIYMPDNWIALFHDKKQNNLASIVVDSYI